MIEFLSLLSDGHQHSKALLHSCEGMPSIVEGSQVKIGFYNNEM